MIANEYDSFVGGQAVAPIDNVTVLELTGADRVNVLNNLCTADLKQLEVGQGIEAFVTDVRGRTVGYVCVFICEDKLRLIGLGQQGESIAAHIDRYVIREDVGIEDRGEANRAFLVSGCKGSPGLPGISTAANRQLACGVMMPEDSPVPWFQVPWTSNDDILVLGDNSISQRLSGLGLSVVGDEVFFTARIEAGMPEFGIDCTDENLPQEIDRNERAISFTKGCYLGQETVARLDAMGQIQKKLVRLSLSGSDVPAPRTKLLSEGKAAGEIRSACPSPTGDGILALGFVRRKWFELGSQMEIEGTDAVATVL